MADIPGIPEYGASPLQCQQPCQCVVSIPTIYEGTIRYTTQVNGSQVENTCPLPPEQVYEWIARALQNMGCTVTNTRNEYITRKVRTSADRAVIPDIIESRYLRRPEGHFADALLTFRVYDTRTGRKVGKASAWGRSDKLHTDAVSNAIANVTTTEKFRSLLLPAPAGTQKEKIDSKQEHITKEDPT